MKDETAGVAIEEFDKMKKVRIKILLKQQVKMKKDMLS